MRNARLKRRLVQFGGADLLRKINKNPRVIFWHGVEYVSETPSLHIAPDVFEEEIYFLNKHYEIISIEEYEDRFRRDGFSGREIVLTFDDGYRNNLTVAAPILKSLNLPFTVFVSTFHIESGQFFPTAIVRMIVLDSVISYICLRSIGLEVHLHDRVQRSMVCDKIISVLKHSSVKMVNAICQELLAHVSEEELSRLSSMHQADRPMTWDDVQKLHDEYSCTIGSHCVDHFICNEYQDEKEVERQLKESKRLIEEKTAASCDYLAYPNGVYKAGDVTPFAMQMVKQAGYKLAFTTVTDRLRRNSNPYLMPRCAARFEMDDFIMKLVLKPKLSWK
ncbi:MAG: polysaccharide deacetylase family protein [Odoribacter sp.]|nr:polysaccharide deacetylase family protein [Odoribacter sp.]